MGMMGEWAVKDIKGEWICFRVEESVARRSSREHKGSRLFRVDDKINVTEAE